MSIHIGVKRWRQTLVTKHSARSLGPRRPAPARQIRSAARAGLSVAALTMLVSAAHAGTWTPLTNGAPGGIALMELLSDGTVIGQNGGGAGWYRLTPDIHGSYINGTWSTIASMNDTRLYGSTAVLPNGSVFYAGGEYGTGGKTSEIYDPIANTWTTTPDAGQNFVDSVSTVLPNGNVLVGPVFPSVSGGTAIYDWRTNTWSLGATYVRGGYQDEASWVKLPDESVLTIDPFGTNSERYIPSLGRWVDDGVVPVTMYDSALGEIGPGVLLPTGKAFYIGDTGHTALYTPSGNTSPGVWTAGPDVPNGLGDPDAPAAMMVNGSVLCAVGPKGTYNAPTTFYEYNPYTNAFTLINGPTGPTDNTPPFTGRMLDLPDGSVLFNDGGNQLYEYRPDTAQIDAARPVPSSIAPNADGSFQLVGTLLTGISEGGEYGDDVQMASNYPIVRLTGGGDVYYGRSSNWNTTSVMQTGPQTAQFTVPNSVPAGNYSLEVVTNGIASAPAPFQVTSITGLTLAPATVVAGSSATGTVTVSLPAPAGGTTVHLDVSDPTSATVPATVTIPFNATSANFTVNTAVRFSHTAVTINAVRGGSRRGATLNINSATGLASLTISPASVAAGTASTGTVTLSQAALGDSVVNLSSSSQSAASVPLTVTVLAGHTTATFPITTFVGHAVLGAVITGTLNGDSQSAKISVTQTIALLSVTITPSTIAAGGTATGKVTLSMAPTAGTWISLRSSDLFDFHVYSGVSVRAGYTTATFPIAVRAGVSPKTATITATYHSVDKSATLSATAP